MTNKDFITRLHHEKAELEERITELTAFMRTDTYFNEVDDEEKHLISVQLQTMDGYRDMLSCRLKRHEQATEQVEEIQQEDEPVEDWENGVTAEE